MCQVNILNRKRSPCLHKCDRERGVYLDPNGVEVWNIHTYNVPGQQELWFSHGDHIISTQEDLFTLGAHRVGSYYLTNNNN